jgi:hypothetical protein
MSAIEGAARTGHVRAYGNEALFERGTWDCNLPLRVGHQFTAPSLAYYPPQLPDLPSE